MLNRTFDFQIMVRNKNFLILFSFQKAFFFFFSFFASPGSKQSFLCFTIPFIFLFCQGNDVTDDW